MTTNKLLIDSHILVWLLLEPERLSESVKSSLQAADTVLFSATSIWELAIKFSKKKLPYSPQTLLSGARHAGLTRLAIADEHILKLPDIELEHGDPFDKLLVAQSVAEGCTFVTADRAILASRYNVLNATT